MRWYALKFGGTPGARPPTVSLHSRVQWELAAWSWFGVALTLLLLSGLNQLTLRLSEERYFLMLGSFGALLALLYGAPNSPLAQPRNAVLGCTVAAGVAVVLNYFSAPEHLSWVPQWVMIAIAPATAIAANQRLGVLHPPAGAAALIFVASPRATDLGWMYLVLPLLVGNVVCCAVAMCVNNVSRNRRYPLFY